MGERSFSAAVLAVSLLLLAAALGATSVHVDVNVDTLAAPGTAQRQQLRAVSLGSSFARSAAATGSAAASSSAAASEAEHAAASTQQQQQQQNEERFLAVATELPDPKEVTPPWWKRALHAVRLTDICQDMGDCMHCITSKHAACTYCSPNSRCVSSDKASNEVCTAGLETKVTDAELKLPGLMARRPLQCDQWHDKRAELRRAESGIDERLAREREESEAEERAKKEPNPDDPIKDSPLDPKADVEALAHKRRREVARMINTEGLPKWEAMVETRKKLCPKLEQDMQRLCKLQPSAPQCRPTAKEQEDAFYCPKELQRMEWNLNRVKQDTDYLSQFDAWNTYEEDCELTMFTRRTSFMNPPTSEPGTSETVKAKHELECCKLCIQRASCTSFSFEMTGQRRCVLIGGLAQTRKQIADWVSGFPKSKTRSRTVNWRKLMPK